MSNETNTLKGGDWCQELTREEWDELMNIENYPDKLIYTNGIALCHDNGDDNLVIVRGLGNAKKKELSKHIFIERAKNTFK